MKTKFILVVLLLIGMVVHGQQKPQHFFKEGETVAPTKSFQIKNVAPTTAFLLLDIEKCKAKEMSFEELQQEWGLLEMEGEFFVNTFVKASPGFDFEIYRAKLGTNGEKLKTYLIPINELYKLANDPDVSYVEVGSKCSLTMDVVREEMGVEQVHSGSGGLSQSYFGEDVIVGIIDGGFDYTHPAFYSNGTFSDYRVLRVWNQNTYEADPPQGYSYGNELVGEQEILNAQFDVEYLSHGSHTSAIAAGNQVLIDEQNYSGIAPKSNFILVSSNMMPAGIADAVSYIFEQAEILGKPCVINISMGGHEGPHDGTSPFDLLCDEMAGPGKIIVGSAGNDGFSKIFLEKEYSDNDTVLRTFVKMDSYNTYPIPALVDIWGEEDEQFKVAVSLFDDQNLQILETTPFVFANQGSVQTFTLQHGSDEYEIEIASSVGENNNKPHILLTINNHCAEMPQLDLFLEIRATNTETKMWTSGAGTGFDRGIFLGLFEAGSDDCTVAEIGGVGNSIISVGAYVTKKKWINIFGDTLINSNQNIGSLAIFSSLGPTADGRTKPDITAPGAVVVSAINSFDVVTEISASNTIVAEIEQGLNTWQYATMQGTSMSAPVVTGIIALWLEANPQLNHHEALMLLKEHAVTDAFTGEIPPEGSNRWGWGKANAFQGLLALEAPASGHYMLYFDAHYPGAIDPMAIEVTAGEAIGVLPVAERQWWTFDAWKIGQDVIDENTIWTYNINKTAVAVWEGDVQVDEYEERNVTIFPNPATSCVNIYGITAKKVDIYDVMGNKILSKKNEMKIDISSLSSGVYIMKIIDQGDNQVVKKIIKQ